MKIRNDEFGVNERRGRNWSRRVWETGSHGRYSSSLYRIPYAGCFCFYAFGLVFPFSIFRSQFFFFIFFFCSLSSIRPFTFLRGSFAAFLFLSSRCSSTLCVKRQRRWTSPSGVRERLAWIHLISGSHDQVNSISRIKGARRDGRAFRKPDSRDSS